MADYTVDAGGGQDFLTIQDAIDQIITDATRGTVTVFAGTYAETVVMPSDSEVGDTTQLLPILIQANGTDVVTINGSISSAVNSTLLNDPIHYEYKNLVISNPTGDALLAARNGCFARVTGCTITGTLRALGAYASVAVVDTQVDGSSASYALRMQQDQNVRGCELINSKFFGGSVYTIEWADGQLGYIRKCTIDGNGGTYGLWADNIAGILDIRQTTFHDCTNGVFFNAGGDTGAEINLENCIFDDVSKWVDASSYVTPLNEAVRINGCRDSNPLAGNLVEFSDETFADVSAVNARFANSENPNASEDVTFSSYTLGDAGYMRLTASMSSQSKCVGIYDDPDGKLRQKYSGMDAGAFQNTSVSPSSPPVPTGLAAFDNETNGDLLVTIDNAASYVAGEKIDIYDDADDSILGSLDGAAGSGIIGGLTNDVLVTIYAVASLSGVDDSAQSATAGAIPTVGPAPTPTVLANPIADMYNDVLGDACLMQTVTYRRDGYADLTLQAAPDVMRAGSSQSENVAVSDGVRSFMFLRGAVVFDDSTTPLRGDKILWTPFGSTIEREFTVTGAQEHDTDQHEQMIRVFVRVVPASETNP